MAEIRVPLQRSMFAIMQADIELKGNRDGNQSQATLISLNWQSC